MAIGVREGRVEFRHAERERKDLWRGLVGRQDINKIRKQEITDHVHRVVAGAVDSD